jgi:hypothetical protein
MIYLLNFGVQRDSWCVQCYKRSCQYNNVFIVIVFDSYFGCDCRIKRHPYVENIDLSYILTSILDLWLQEKQVPQDQYNLVTYLAYILYAPLYLAGPIITYNAFASQVFSISTSVFQ